MTAVCSSCMALGSACSSGCAEYIDSLLHNYKALETKYRPLSSYMHKVQHEATPQMREILVSWLSEVAREFQLSLKTLCLTVDFIDRYLSLAEVARTRLQLVGVTCMLIASKFEEVKPPYVDDFVFMTDCAYTRAEMLELERAILKALRFSCAVPTAKDFAGVFLVSERAGEVVYALSDYLIELSLGDYEMLKHPPSAVGAAAAWLALTTVSVAAGLGQFATRPWSTALGRQLQRHPAEATQCLEEMLRLWSSTYYLNGPHVVRAKYASLLFHGVSTEYRPPAEVPLPV
eukprot:RCo006898